MISVISANILQPLLGSDFPVSELPNSGDNRWTWWHDIIEQWYYSETNLPQKFHIKKHGHIWSKRSKRIATDLSPKRKPRALGATPPMELNVKGSGAIKWGLPSQTPRACRGDCLDMSGCSPDLGPLVFWDLREKHIQMPAFWKHFRVG